MKYTQTHHMTTTTTTTPDYAQPSFGELYGGDFARTERVAQLPEKKRLVAAQAQLSTEDVYAAYEDWQWRPGDTPEHPDCLRISYSENSWPSSELKTRVELAAHRYGLCVADCFPNYLLVVGSHAIGADAPSLADFRAWQRKRDEHHAQRGVTRAERRAYVR